MTDLRCVCCRGSLEPAQGLRFLVETANLDNPTYLAAIRRLPARHGRPVPVCTPCQKLIETAPRRAPVRRTAGPVSVGLLATVGLLSVGWLIQTLLLGTRE